MPERFPDASVESNVALELKLIDAYDELLRKVELEILRQAKDHDAQAFHLLDSVAGIGKILALVMLYEVHDIRRFPRVQDFVSYCRLVKSKKESAGKCYGTSDNKIGNAHFKVGFLGSSRLVFEKQSRRPSLPGWSGKETRQGQSPDRFGAQTGSGCVSHALEE